MSKTVIFDGREFASKKAEALIPKMMELTEKGIIPHLVSILVGDDPASHLYVSLKRRAVEKMGGEMTIVALNQNVSLEKILEAIKWYNNDSEIHGIMVQFPLPEKLQDSKFQIRNSPIDYLLIDAFYIPYVKGLRRKNQLAIVKGDTKSISIAAASIVAKVYRDKLMTALAKEKGYKKYKWHKNKGYGTKEHRQAIKRYGITKLHRKKFVQTYQEKIGLLGSRVSDLSFRQDFAEFPADFELRGEECKFLSPEFPASLLMRLTVRTIQTQEQLRRTLQLQYISDSNLWTRPA